MILSNNKKFLIIFKLNYKYERLIFKKKKRNKRVERTFVEQFQLYLSAVNSRNISWNIIKNNLLANKLSLKFFITFCSSVFLFFYLKIFSPITNTSKFGYFEKKKLFNIFSKFPIKLLLKNCYTFDCNNRLLTLSIYNSLKFIKKKRNKISKFELNWKNLIKFLILKLFNRIIVLINFPLSFFVWYLLYFFMTHLYLINLFFFLQGFNFIRFWFMLLYVLYFKKYILIFLLFNCFTNLKK